MLKPTVGPQGEAFFEWSDSESSCVGTRLPCQRDIDGLVASTSELRLLGQPNLPPLESFSEQPPRLLELVETIVNESEVRDVVNRLRITEAHTELHRPTWGVLFLQFLPSGEIVEIMDDLVRWNSKWSGDARLTDPASLSSYLKPKFKEWLKSQGYHHLPG